MLQQIPSFAAQHPNQILRFRHSTNTTQGADGVKAKAGKNTSSSRIRHHMLVRLNKGKDTFGRYED